MPDMHTPVDHTARPSAFYPGKTAQQAVDDVAADLLAHVHGDTPGAPIDNYGEKTVRATEFTLGSGPIQLITFVFDKDGDIDYAVVEYTEGGPRAHHVITDPCLPELLDALRRYEPQS